MFIHNAQNFGLSDLHQMRGRVGRSNKKAFCYFLTPPLSAMSSDAQKRIRTIEQFSALGSGIQIAMKDLKFVELEIYLEESKVDLSMKLDLKPIKKYCKKP